MKIFRDHNIVAAQKGGKMISVSDNSPRVLFNDNDEINIDKVYKWAEMRVASPNQNDFCRLKVKPKETNYKSINDNFTFGKEYKDFEIYTAPGNCCKYCKGNTLYKGTTKECMEPFSEYIGSRVFSKFSNLPTVIYDIEDSSKNQNLNIRTRYMSSCKQIGSEVFRFYDYLELHDIERKDVLKTYIDLGLSMDFLIQVLIIDALIGNQNRHWNSFNIYIDNSGYFKNAPVLNFGRSLLYNVPELELSKHNKIGKDDSEPLKENHSEQIKYLLKLSEGKKYFDFTWLDLLITVSRCFQEIPEEYSLDRKQTIINYLYSRYNKYITPFLK